MADSSSSKPNSPLPTLGRLTSEAEHGSKSDKLDAVWQPRGSREKVALEGYVDGGDGGGDGAGRTKSLTEDDLEELRACVDLGFSFNYDSIPELVPTLPALDLCYSLSQQYLNEQQGSVRPPLPQETAAPPVTNWKISGPGEDPEKVKAKLKYWAQVVACTVRLCN